MFLWEQEVRLFKNKSASFWLAETSLTFGHFGPGFCAQREWLEQDMTGTLDSVVTGFIDFIGCEHVSLSKKKADQRVMAAREIVFKKNIYGR